ncbi:class I SAM-dependent methyltransferase [Pseudothauera rhizosphaerae]|uniref:Class I SAM-dependent methyltransferase n=1 Tax=Pseudothauera rhizosphaerae TaxID=2565932 RepID=A0A4S4APF1_9RHOO|nr:class I SAM-dependent methyltransferase [Pseudothauera rhizosphaerae]THF61565.1 class I SAM-dependent methyltransferase [Pseudothauera rhizosphaerae]
MSRNTVPAGIELPFSAKYDAEHSQAYHDKHHGDLRRRLSNWRDQQLARRALALAGEPPQVLDLPCGAGRFWETLAERPERRIIAADNSAAMLEVALRHCRPALLERIRPLHTSAFAIDLPDQSVDSIFCMRLLHHIGESEHRLALLREFHRVTRDTAILSLWVDGNYLALRRGRQEARRHRHGRNGFQNRHVLARSAAEAEFALAGFAIAGHLDFLPLHSMWRVYVLRRA